MRYLLLFLVCDEGTEPAKMLSKVLEMKQLEVELELNSRPSHFIACAPDGYTILPSCKAPERQISVVY